MRMNNFPWVPDSEMNGSQTCDFVITSQTCQLLHHQTAQMHTQKQTQP